MKVRSVTFLDDGEAPETVTVEMTAREAAFLARLTGRLSHSAAEEIAPGYAADSGRIFGALASLFNRFYDDGHDEALRELAQ